MLRSVLFWEYRVDPNPDSGRLENFVPNRCHAAAVLVLVVTTAVEVGKLVYVLVSAKGLIWTVHKMAWGAVVEEILCAVHHP